jgi:hypothetical protein
MSLPVGCRSGRKSSSKKSSQKTEEIQCLYSWAHAMNGTPILSLRLAISTERDEKESAKICRLAEYAEKRYLVRRRVSANSSCSISEERNGACGFSLHAVVLEQGTARASPRGSGGLDTLVRFTFSLHTPLRSRYGFVFMAESIERNAHGSSF